MLGLGSGNKQKVNFLENGERTRDVQGFSFWVFLRSEPFFVCAAKLRSGMAFSDEVGLRYSIKRWIMS